MMMKKNFLFLRWALAICLCVSANVAFGQVSIGSTFTGGDGITYKVTGDSPYTVQVGDGTNPNTIVSGALVITDEVVDDQGYVYEVTAVGDYAFMGNTNITDVTIGDAILSIGNSAFYTCDGLKTLTIEGRPDIGSKAFYLTTSALNFIQNIILASPTPPTIAASTSEDFPFNTAAIGTSTIIPALYGKIHIPCNSGSDYESSNWNFFTIWDLSEAEIGDEFIDNSIIYKVTSDSPLQVEVVTALAHFSGALVIPGTVSICDNTYTVTSIANSAFHTRNITSLSLPATITTIGSAAFYGLSLSAIYCFATTPPTGNAFGNVSTSTPVYVPCSSLNDYQDATYWKNFTAIQTLGNSTTLNSNLTVSSLSTYCSLTVPANVTVTVNSGATLVASTLTLEDGAQLINNGTANFGSVIYKKTFTANQWYAVGFPFDVASVTTTYNGSNLNLITYDENGDDTGDYWLRTHPTSETGAEGFVDYAAGSESFTAGGYILEVPVGLTLNFTSAASPALSGTFSVPSGRGYTLLANPSTAAYTLTEGDGKYYYTYVQAKNNFDRISGGTATVQAFESFVIATGIDAGNLRSSFSAEEATALPTISGDDPVVRTEYYNLQGVRVTSLRSSSPYIVKTITKSGKTASRVEIR